MNIANYYITNPDNRKLVAPCKEYIPDNLVDASSNLFLVPVLFPAKASGQVVEAAAWVDPARRLGILVFNAPQTRGITSVINGLSMEDEKFLSLYLAKLTTRDSIVVLFPKHTDGTVVHHTRFVIYEGVDIKQYFDYSSSHQVVMGLPPLAAIGRLESRLTGFPSLQSESSFMVKDHRVHPLSTQVIRDANRNNSV